jgi:uncharacterized protein (TIGR04255 family)
MHASTFSDERTGSVNVSTAKPLIQSIRPKFQNPPLFEQAIAVVFDEIAPFTIGDFGLFWPELGDEFATTETQPMVQRQIEQFDGTPQAVPQLQLLPANSIPRCFYRHKSGHELVQLQSDRFGFNWLKQDGAVYPHSEETFERFFSLLNRFLSFCSRRGFGDIAIKQCEISNVNILLESEFGNMSTIAQYIAPFPTMSTPQFLEAESATYATHHRIVDSEGSPLGRLHQVCNQVVWVETSEMAFRLELTARGAPIGAGLAGVSEFFSVARSAITGAFLSATTERAHERWGYKNGDGI